MKSFDLRKTTREILPREFYEFTPSISEVDDFFAAGLRKLFQAHKGEMCSDCDESECSAAGDGVCDKDAGPPTQNLKCHLVHNMVTFLIQILAQLTKIVSDAASKAGISEEEMATLPERKIDFLMIDLHQKHPK